MTTSPHVTWGRMYGPDHACPSCHVLDSTYDESVDYVNVGTVCAVCEHREAVR